MRVLLTGSRGQLGWELQRTVPPGVELVSVDVDELDVASGDAVAAFAAAQPFELIINAAAYTAVDRAEAEPEAAFRVNGEAPGHLARAAGRRGQMIQVSTDFVFDGNSGSPYLPESPTAPLGVYGASKLEGERRAREVLGDRCLVLRTAWLYSVQGSNFVKTMLRLMRERDSVSVVADQVGTPTWAATLARTIWALTSTDAFGRTLHCTDAGAASWYDFAVAIAEEALAFGLLERLPTIRPIPAAEYPVPARRPSYSVLDKTETWALLGETAPHWRVSLRRMLGELACG